VSRRSKEDEKKNQGQELGVGDIPINVADDGESGMLKIETEGRSLVKGTVRRWEMEGPAQFSSGEGILRRWNSKTAEGTFQVSELLPLPFV
jgi:hypothetical protein